jgi:hypothetical protein
LSRASEISLGDLLRAVRQLRADDETRFAIARLLKLTPFESREEMLRLEELERARQTPAAPPAASAVTAAGIVKPSQPGVAGEERFDAPLTETPVRADLPPDSLLPFTLKKTEEGRLRPPAWSENFSPLQKSTPLVEAGKTKRFEPLFLPAWIRGILSGALSSRSYDGAIDVYGLIKKLSGGEKALKLPRLPRPTLARGVQVLVDRSETMLPFAEDQNWLEREVRKIISEQNARLLYFDGCPTRKVGRGSRRDWKNYEENYLPPRGTVLLLLTDLGIGQRPSMKHSVGVEEWAAFATRLRKRGCPLVAFVPYAPARWPIELRRLIMMIQWDRPTGASVIHARIGKGHSTESPTT